MNKYCRKQITVLAVAGAMALTTAAETMLPGVVAEYYSFGSVPLSSMPDFDTLVPSGVAVVDSIDYPASYEPWEGLGDDFADNFAVRYTAFLDVPVDGDYTFILESDDGSILCVDGETLIDNSSLHAMNLVTNCVHLAAGYHAIGLDFFEKDGQAGLRLSWEGPGVNGVISSGNLVQDVSSDLEFYAGLYGVPPSVLSEIAGSATWEEVVSNSIAFAGFAPGLQVEYHSFRENPLSAIPDFTALSPRRVGFADKVAYSKCEMYDVVAHDFAFTGSFASRHFGYLYVNAAGTYGFRLKSDDGSRLVVDGTTVVDNDGLHAVTTATGGIFLGPGMHEVELLFFGHRNDSLLELSWTTPGATSPVLVPSTRLFHRAPGNFAPKVSVLSPDQGGVYAAGQPVELSADVRDFDGEVAEVSYYTAAGELVGVSSNAPWAASWTPANGGLTSIYAVATDDGGASRRSPAVSFEVRLPPRGLGTGLRGVFRQNSGPHLGETLAMVVPSLDFPSTTSAWKGLPQWMVDNFSAEFTGYLFVEKADYYTFKLSSDDGSELWLDGERLIDHGTPHSYTAKYASAFLSVGLHAIRVTYFDDQGHAGLDLSWSSPSFEMHTVAPHELVHETTGLDNDHDGMHDWWEEFYGLDFVDPSDASFDPDGDGLDNLFEFQHGTSPNSPDTDADGMPDSWEVANGTRSFIADAFDDPDEDGLSNIDEYRAGTNPHCADTDSDGCPDGVEFWNARSNPLVPDLVWGAPVAVGEAVSARSPLSTTGIWNVDSDGVIYAGVRAGSLTWRLSVPDGGADALAVRVVQHEFFATESDFDLSLKVDGVFVARTCVRAPYGHPADAVFFIPEVAPGEHEFRIVWHNWGENTFLGVLDLRFLNFEGPDADGNGVADWRDSRDAKGAALNPIPNVSLVSPVCVEGRGMWGGSLVLNVDYGSSNAVFSAVRTIGDGFYADIPLAEEGLTAISFVEAGRTNVAQVAWEAIDVFGGDYAENALVVRTGDALRFAHGGASAEYTISRNDDGSWNEVTNLGLRASCAYEFSEAGSYLVTAIVPGIFGDDEAHALVEVVSSRFPSRNPAIQLQGQFEVDCPGLAPANVLEHDAGLSVSAEATPSGGVTLSVYASEDRDYGLVSRLDEDGSISDTVQATPVWFDNGTYCRVLQTYPDGSQLIEVSLLLGAIPEGMTVFLQIFVSGVTFEDGSSVKTLTADDFDENGMCSVRFVKALGVTTSVCHRTYLRQDGKYVFGN